MKKIAVYLLCLSSGYMPLSVQAKDDLFAVMQAHMNQMSQMMSDMAENMRKQQDSIDALFAGEDNQDDRSKKEAMTIQSDDSTVTLSMNLTDVISDKIDTRIFTDYRGIEWLEIVVPGAMRTIKFTLSKQIVISEKEITRETKKGEEKSSGFSRSVQYARQSQQLPAAIVLEDVQVAYDENTQQLSITMPKVAKKNRITINRKK